MLSTFDGTLVQSGLQMQVSKTKQSWIISFTCRHVYVFSQMFLAQRVGWPACIAVAATRSKPANVVPHWL